MIKTIKPSRSEKIIFAFVIILAIFSFGSYFLIKDKCFFVKDYDPQEIIFDNPKNLEKITRIFFSQRRKKIKHSMKQLFKNPDKISRKLKIDLNLRPQNLTPLDYFLITREYENLLS